MKSKINGLFQYVYKCNAFALLCAVLPWSIDWAVSNGVRMHLLSEPLCALVAVGVAYKLWRAPERRGEIWRSYRWPLLLVLCGLGWGWLCVGASSMPLVSTKYMLVNTVYVLAFLGFPLLYRAQWARGIEVLLYALAGAGGWFVLRHWGMFGGRSDQANLAAMPFFDDHNQLAAVLGMAAFVGMAKGRQYRWVALALVVPVCFSTSRGGLLGLCAGAVLAGLYWLFKKNTPWVMGALVVLVGLFWLAFLPKITTRFKSEVSMAERWNRYQCALQMGQERPVMGFGPGTYAFQYLPYQQVTDRTRISLERPLVDRAPANYGYGGGAHSEYLQALSEMGWPGLCLLLALVAWPWWMVGPVMPERAWLLGAWGSYWVHGLLNNFLHDPKIAVLVWGVFFMLLDYTTSSQYPGASYPKMPVNAGRGSKSR